DVTPVAPTQIAKEPHVAGRHRSDEGFLRVNAARVVQRRRDNVGTWRSRDDRPAIKSPFMRAAVLSLGKVAVACAGPANSGGIKAHAPAPYQRAHISKTIVAPQTSMVDISPVAVRSFIELSRWNNCHVPK